MQLRTDRYLCKTAVELAGSEAFADRPAWKPENLNWGCAEMKQLMMVRTGAALSRSTYRTTAQSRAAGAHVGDESDRAAQFLLK